MMSKALMSGDRQQAAGALAGKRVAGTIPEGRCVPIPGRPMAGRVAVVLLVLAALMPGVAPAQIKGAMGTDPETVKQVRAWNAECLQCHVGDSLQEPGKSLFSLPKDTTASARVSPGFAASYHGNMACKTCHIGGYLEYPHNVFRGRKAETLQCDECHAQESFRVEAQVAKSVHSENLKENFTCSTCHDPHLTISAKRLGSISVEKLVAQDNAMCLNCHNSDKRFVEFGGKVLPDKQRPDIDKIHDWLPNTRRHWEAARCIDCHTPPSTHRTLALSHEILNKDKAQRNCAVCHTLNSALRVRLYRHITEIDTRELGFVNAAFLRSSYVIGATRNTYLDALGLIMVGGTLAAVIVHGLLRIFIARRRRSP